MRTSAMSPGLSIFVRSGLSAAVYLGLSVPALLIGVLGLSGLMPMSHALEAVAPLILAAILLICYGLADALWGRSPALQVGETRTRRLMWASAPCSTDWSALLLANLTCSAWTPRQLQIRCIS